jgi:exopolyphosphatase/guanosine-5'-triphosphate,3'-diphosphate pyrophosphatase
MATIIPRWEWRTFGTRFRRAETVFAGLDPKDVQESDEVYLLTETGSNVKIRNELLDIKVLQEVNAAGLEQWIPVMKAGFPLSAATVDEVFKAMDVPTPPLARGEYTLEQFLAELVEPHLAVRMVQVHKRRVRYTVGGCMSELSEVTVGGKKTKTIAVETENAEAVVAAVRSLGLADYVNTNYTRGLADFVGGGHPRCAIIDVGTNSVKFHIGEAAGDGTWRAVVDRAELTRLGEGLEKSGIIAWAAIERTATAIAGMAHEARRNRCVAITAVGTAGLRIAHNADEVIEAIRSQTGVTIEIISGEEEGRLAYLAVRAELPLGGGTLVVFDTGGGSSQFTFGQGERVVERFSVDVGAVRYTERFGLSGVVTSEVLAEALAAISADLSRIDGRPQPDTLAGMGGAVTNLTAVSYRMAKYDPDVVQGTILHRSEIERQIELYRSTPVEARREIVGLQPKRADVILAGACIVRTIMDKLGKDSLTVSDRGLRHGLLVDRFGE